ncbi:fungal lipase-like domain-containing protein, partial [Zopfochytrium polystomum]
NTSRSTSRYAGINDNIKSIVLSFRGTENIKNWIHNIQFKLKDMEQWGKGVKVHDGFYKTYDSVSKPLVAAVIALKAKCKKCRLLFTGHSLGGAVATIAAVDMVSKSIIEAPKTSIVTNGQPRVGNMEFAEIVNEMGFSKLLRAVSKDDG